MDIQNYEEIKRIIDVVSRQRHILEKIPNINLDILRRGLHHDFALEFCQDKYDLNFKDAVESTYDTPEISEAIFESIKKNSFVYENFNLIELTHHAAILQP